MMPRTPIHTALLMAVIAAVGVVVMDRASAAESQIPGVSVVGDNAHTRSETLKVGKSVVLDFPREIKDVLVSDPKIANAVIRSSRRAYIMGNSSGETNIVFFDAEGKQMADYEITVISPIKINSPPSRDVSIIANAIRRHIPRAHVNVESIGDGIILSGTVANDLEAQQAYDIASHFVAPNDAISNSNGSSYGSSNGSGGSASVTQNGQMPSKERLNAASASKIVNLIVVLGRDQVMLKVTVAEMDRQVIKQLGVNLNGSVGFGSAVFNFNNNNPFPVNGPPSNLGISPSTALNKVLSPLSTALTGQFATPSGTAAGNVGGAVQGITANLQAMEQVGAVHTLAEPTLTAISGESAHFLAGGSFPYPSITSCTTTPCPPVIAFQNFGVSLIFTPVVLSEGRISLHVATEVSQLDPANSVTVAGTTVPGLTVRRADTTAEISSGGTLVMAGMIQDQTKQTITGLPGLMEVPILGALFKSRDYLNNETELVVLVTPYIAHAVAQKDLSRPTDGFADPSDPATVLLGRLNRIYGVTASPPNLPFQGKFGFILD